jgi:hypothetical protein
MLVASSCHDPASAMTSAFMETEAPPAGRGGRNGNVFPPAPKRKGANSINFDRFQEQHNWQHPNKALDHKTPAALTRSRHVRTRANCRPLSMTAR